MTRWAMVADLERCVGCQTCTAACRHTNATSPAVQWRKVLDVEAGRYPHVSRVFVPVGCQHCEDPPCMHVCPSTATRRRADGIVTIDYSICIGCAYCDVACPYQARFKEDVPGFAYGAAATRNEIEREDPARIGVAQKCTFCADRIDDGLSRGLVPGQHPQATPACVNACIADALQFGDLDDPDSNVSQLLRTQRHFRMHEELGTGPGFYYLYASRDAAEDETSASGPDQVTAAGSIRSKGVEPFHQQHWNWKAAGNFMAGSAGAGLFAAAALACLIGGAPLMPFVPAAVMLMALGLFLVLLKIGRPLRFVHVLRQPRRSWMAREAWIAVIFFPLAAAAFWFDSAGLLLAAAVAALAFLFAQAMILREAKGVPVWREPRLVPLMLATGLAEGAGLFLAFAAGAAPQLGVAAAVAALLLSALRAYAWRDCRRALERTGAPLRSLEALAGAGNWLVAIGFILPAGLAALGGLIGAASGALLVLAGLCICGAGWAFKFVLITGAGFNQGFALAHTPVRGTGQAGPAVKPGWSMPMEVRG